MKANPHSVLLVDDHSLYREGLREIFSNWTDFEVVGEASNGMEAIEFCDNVQPIWCSWTSRCR